MKRIFCIAMLTFCFSGLLPARAQQGERELPKLIVFHSPGCHNCAVAKEKVMPGIEKEFSGRISIEYRDVDQVENYKFLLSLQEKYRVRMTNTLPVFFFEGKFINGQGNIGRALRALIMNNMQGMSQAQAPLPKIDLIERFRGFTLLAVVSVGLLDGINPCAFTVIVFFISFLAFQGYRKGEIAVIGLLFILAVFITYVLIGLGIFEALYRLQGFRLLTKIINLTLGFVSILFGIYALHDFIRYKKTKSTDNMVLSLPQAVKNQIHKVIGAHYRVHGGDELRRDRRLFKLGVTALITGFLVCLLEAVCTGQTYLPTIAFVLKTTNIKLKALVYLLAYNLMFVAPLFMILGLALAGTTSQRFQAVLKRHLGAIKILMSVMFMGLGIFLLWRA